MSSCPSAPAIQKVSAEQYLNLITGELCDFQKSDTRADNTDSLRKSFKQLRDIVNCNTTDNSCIHWVTLTYAENMTDTKQLYSDFDRFWKRFRRYCTKQGWNIPQYISPGLGSDPHYTYQPGRLFNHPVITRITLTRYEQ